MLLTLSYSKILLDITNNIYFIYLKTNEITTYFNAYLLMCKYNLYKEVLF